jgi:hypothetical protein
VAWSLRLATYGRRFTGLANLFFYKVLQDPVEDTVIAMGIFIAVFLADLDGSIDGYLSGTSSEKSISYMPSLRMLMST